VNKISRRNQEHSHLAIGGGELQEAAGPAVTEKPSTNFISMTLRARRHFKTNETKQVEFVHAEKMFAPTIYVYDGVGISV